jgi:hypothetical protein
MAASARTNEKEDIQMPKDTIEITKQNVTTVVAGVEEESKKMIKDIKTEMEKARVEVVTKIDHVTAK